MTAKGPKIRSTERNEEFSIKNICVFPSVQRVFRTQIQRNNIKYKKIGNLESGKYYNYMDLETALICLENKTFRFLLLTDAVYH